MCCLLFVACRVLFAVCCVGVCLLLLMSFAGCWWLVVALCVLLIVRCLLLGVCCLSRGVCCSCLLFVGCCCSVFIVR